MLLLLAGFAGQAQVTTNGGSGLAPTYTDLAGAITALNAATITSPVVITLTAGNPQTPTVGGYVINAQGSATNTIIIAGSGNTLTASGSLISGSLNDAFFKIIGGDYITIDSFIMMENAANTTTIAGSNNMTEWGVALLHATATNGAQNNTIKNCTIDLDRTYLNTFGIYNNTNHTPTSINTGEVPSTAAGANSGLTVIGNTITDVNVGIVVVGPSIAGIESDGLTIGGSASNGNTISNFGTNGTATSYFNVSGTVNGIYIRFVKNVTISYNTITSSNGASTLLASALRGIYMQSGTAGFTGTIVNNFNNNVISLKIGNTTGPILGILLDVTTVNATTTLNINNNDFNNFVNTVAASSGAVTCISNAGPALVTNINGNTFTNLNFTTTGAATLILNNILMPANGSQTVNDNSIVTGLVKSGSGGTLTLFTTTANSPSGTTSFNNNNNFSNITVTGSTVNAGWINRDGASTVSGPTKTITGNTFSNWTTGTGSVTAFTENAGSPASVVSGNTISNISGTAAVIGVSILSNSNSSFRNNTINTLSTTGAALVSGISITGTPTANNTPRILKNKVYDLLANNAGGTVSGILIGFLGTTSNSDLLVANNLVGDLKAPVTNLTTTDAIRGININPFNPAVNSKYNIYYNTIYINASSSGANFGTAGIFHARSATATSGTLDLRNNIIINTSTASGTGTTAAFSRSNAGLENYAATSNNNIFYAGTPSATNVIYYDSTGGGKQTISDFKTFVAPRETMSATENVAFQSTTGSSSSFLHINNSVATVAQSGAAVIATVTDDYDSDTRSATPDIGADEFDVQLPVSITNLKGTRQPEGIVLSWTTVTETNNSGFEILRSADGKTFSKLIAIDSKAPGGSSTGKLDYSFTDQAPLAASNYYRLKQTDRGGSITLSNIVLLKGGKSDRLAVTSMYPNPAIDQLHVLISSPVAGKINLVVVDMAGKTQQVQSIEVVKGETNINLNVSGLTAGNYFVKLVGEAGKASSKFIKQ
ncbi:MAG: T9SS type A sorting domain-containing protein [Chitinophagaceae bacterium]